MISNKICKAGHTYDSSIRGCPICKKESRRRWYLKNREYKLDRNKRWNESNKDKRKSYAEQNRIKNKDKLKLYKESRKDIIKNSNLLRNYNITLVEYNKMVDNQQNSCAICGCSGEKCKYKQLSVDHNHSTGIVRGLLCNRCNMALGLIDDSIETAKSIIMYLSRGEL